MNKALKMLEKVNVNDEWMRKPKNHPLGNYFSKMASTTDHGRRFVPKFDPNIVFRDHIDRDFREQTKEEKAYSEDCARKCFTGPWVKRLENTNSNYWQSVFLVITYITGCLR